jgi:type II secretory ATPase GspE/PulE/Tfp pilus assembly ATPase PilB-like protein
LSTLHTNDAPTALTRLLDLDVAAYLVASTVDAVLAQRLVRDLYCKVRRPQRSHRTVDVDALDLGESGRAKAANARHGVPRTHGHLSSS